MSNLQSEMPRKFRVTNKLQIPPEGDLTRPQGPGEIYRIEILVMDLVVLRRPVSVSRPTMYLVVDEWSGYIGGFYLSLTEPCPEDAVSALLSVWDMREVCLALGVRVDPSEWPIMPVPSILCCDFAREFSHPLARLGIEALRPPLYRGDAKSRAEQIVGMVSHALETAVGGAESSDPVQSGQLTAPSFTLDEFKALLVTSILKLNKAHCPAIELPAQAQSDAVPKVPASVFDWGLRHTTGTGRQVDIEAIRKALLPSVDRARLTNDGIRVSAAGLTGLVYRPCTRDLHTLYADGEITEVKVQYDSRCVDFVWATHPKTNALIRCDLFPSDLRGMSWAEALSLRQKQTNRKRMTGD